MPRGTSAATPAAAYGPVRPTREAVEGPGASSMAGALSSWVPCCWRMSSCDLSCARAAVSWGCSLSPAGPNATLQAPPIAEARNERRLLAVACKRLLGRGPALENAHMMTID